MTGDFAFEPVTHVYRWRGQIVPSVTQILQAQGIIDYSHIPPATCEMALERGRLVHQLTQWDDEAALDETSVDRLLAPYLAAWRRFRAETAFCPDRIEYRSYDEIWRYAGTLDRTGSFGDGSMAVLDIKTNNAPEWVRLQIAAYQAFLPESRRFRRIAVELHGDETYRMLEFRASKLTSDLSDFRAVLRAHQLRIEFNR